MDVTHSNEDNKNENGNRMGSVSNDEWKQQTLVDARHIFQAQVSAEPHQQYQEQHSGHKCLILFK